MTEGALQMIALGFVLASGLVGLAAFRRELRRIRELAAS